jgi:hypothetical protein
MRLPPTTSRHTNVKNLWRCSEAFVTLHCSKGVRDGNSRSESSRFSRSAPSDHKGCRDPATLGGMLTRFALGRTFVDHRQSLSALRLARPRLM